MRRKNKAKWRNRGFCVLKPRVLVTVQNTATKTNIQAVAVRQKPPLNFCDPKQCRSTYLNGGRISQRQEISCLQNLRRFYWFPKNRTGILLPVLQFFALNKATENGAFYPYNLSLRVFLFSSILEPPLITSLLAAVLFYVANSIHVFFSVCFTAVLAAVQNCLY